MFILEHTDRWRRFLPLGLAALLLCGPPPCAAAEIPPPSPTAVDLSLRFAHFGPPQALDVETVDSAFAGVRRNNAADIWAAAGFDRDNLTEMPGLPGKEANYKIGFQSLVGGLVNPSGGCSGWLRMVTSTRGNSSKVRIG